MKNILIVGAGPGGLSAAIQLQAAGFDVTVYEKEDRPGGRNRHLEVGDYTFDTGPTFFLMKYVLEEIFEMAGKKLEDYVELHRINPMYRLKYSEDKIFYPYDSSRKDEMMKQIEKILPGESKNYLKYLEKESKKFDKVISCIYALPGSG